MKNTTKKRIENKRIENQKTKSKNNKLEKKNIFPLLKKIRKQNIVKIK